MMTMKNKRNNLQSYATLLLTLLVFAVFQGPTSANDNGFNVVQELVYRADGNYDENLIFELAEAINDMNNISDKIKGYVVFGAVLCEIPGCEEQAQAVFKRIPRMGRNLTTEFKDLIARTAAACGSERSAVPPERTVRPNVEVMFAGVIGKGGDVMHITSTDSLREHGVRLYKKLQREGCVRHVESLAGSEYVVKSSGDFTVAVQDDEELTHRLLAQLQDILTRFCRLYDMEAPEHLIVVYLARNNWNMVQLARQIHGIHISQSTFGYTCKADSSIVLRRSGGLGTLGHEVFHALLDHNFPEAPPWLNEGMACLYEEYRTTASGGILGKFRRDHWRLVNSPLRSDPSSLTGIPSIEQIVRMDWETFSARNRSPEEAQLNHLTAKMFVMFLQDKHLLKPVFNQVREIGVDDIKIKGPIENFEIHLLETVCNKPLDVLQSEFNEWLLEKL